jgi:hypothetical protein
VALQLLLLFAALHSPSLSAAASKEYQLKAAFLYNFTKFTEWPVARLPEPDSPIVIGVFRSNPFEAELENAVKNRKVNGREIIVKTVESVQTAKATHLLFIPAAEDEGLNDLLPALRTEGILTVGESSAFAKLGGILTFALEGDKLRFEINMDAADRAGLRVSAQLQKLAKAVRRKR